MEEDNKNIPGVYIVQPGPLIGTNNYKFGMSYDVYKRIKSYNKETKIIYIFYTNYPLYIEKIIKNVLEYYIISGQEYFSIDNELELRKLIINVINSINKIHKYLNNEKIVYYKMNDKIIRKPIEDNKTIKCKNIKENKVVINKVIDNKELLNQLYSNNNSLYICIRCGKSFNNNKYHLKKHLKRKFVCIPFNRNICNKLLIDELDNNNYIEYFTEKCKEYKCDYCDKYYKHQSSMIKHRHQCINDILLNKNLNNQEKLLKKNNEKQKVKEKKVKEQNEIINLINNYSEEEYELNENVEMDIFEELDNNDKIEYIISKNEEIFDIIYENPKNHNFEIINKNKKVCKLYDKNEYVIINLDILIIKIIDIIKQNYDNIIIEFMEELRDYNDIYNKTKNKNLHKFYVGYKKICKSIKEKIIMHSYKLK